MNKNAGLAIIATSLFQGKDATADTNGLDSMYLTPIAGRVPNRNVLSGTVAKNSGFLEGKSYLAKWTKLQDDPEYGPQYGWTKVQEIVDPMAVIKAEQELGSGTIFDVTKADVKVESPEHEEQEN